MSCGMQDGGNKHSVRCLVHLVDHPKRKAVGILPANVFVRMPSSIEQRVICKGIPNSDYLLHEFAAQSRLSRLVPNSGLGHILFDLGSDDHPPAHLGGQDRNRAFIVSSAMDDSGFCRCFAKRSSTSVSSCVESGDSSSSKARRISNCRCSSVSDGNPSRTSVKLTREHYHING